MIFIEHCAGFVVFRQRQKSAGFTFFEFGVALAIFSILLLVFVQRIAFYRDEAERAAMLATVANMRTGIYLRVAHLRTQDKADEVAGLAGQNPIAWLAQLPPNYVGEYFSPGRDVIPPGNWYFDRTTKSLFYLFRENKSFAQETSKRVGFKVELAHLPASSAKPPATPETNEGVVLVQVIDATAVKNDRTAVDNRGN